MKPRVVKCEVLVVGSGMAGLCAALTALESGRSVVVLESQDEVGGTTALSDGFFSCFDPKRQIRRRIEDSPEKHLNDVLRTGRRRNHERLAGTFCYEALPTLSWLEGLGFSFLDETVQAEGAPYPRCHLPRAGGGAEYVDFLCAQIKKRGAVVMTGTKATSLRFSKALGRVVGADAIYGGGGRAVILASCGVVLACGGFQANPEMLAKYSPMLAGAESFGSPGCTGDLLAKAEDIGAQTVHCGYFVWKTCSVGPDVLLHPEKFILLDSSGERFCREDLQHDALGERILQLGSKRAWCVCEGAGKIEAPFPQTQLVRAVERYNRNALRGFDSEFGKNSRLLRPIEGGIQVFEARTRICTTLGGLFIDEAARVLDRKGSPVKGLAAAGDCTGGLFGCWAAVGDSLASAAVFGRIAGRTISGAA